MLTALAFLRFAEVGVQCAVVEVGVGGTLAGADLNLPGLGFRV